MEIKSELLRELLGLDRIDTPTVRFIYKSCHLMATFITSGFFFTFIFRDKTVDTNMMEHEICDQRLKSILDVISSGLMDIKYTYKLDKSYTDAFNESYKKLFPNRKPNANTHYRVRVKIHPLQVYWLRERVDVYNIMISIMGFCKDRYRQAGETRILCPFAYIYGEQFPEVVNMFINMMIEENTLTLDNITMEFNERHFMQLLSPTHVKSARR